MSERLDENQEILGWVTKDLCLKDVLDTGRQGLPAESVLQKTISHIKDSTWERINQRLLNQASEEKVEMGKKVRIDSTVTESMIHAPTDSSLLFDCVRAMVRLLKQLREMDGAPTIEFCNHQRVAKKRARTIIYTRGQDKKAKLYADLLNVTKKTNGYHHQR